VADAIRSLSGRLDLLPAAPSVAVIQDWLKSSAFARWYARPEGDWPLVRLPTADLEKMGLTADARVGRLSAATAQRTRQPTRPWTARA
jgi:hypothetical protein